MLLSEEAYVQYYEIEILIQAISDNSGQDKWHYIWGNGHYSSVKAYRHLLGSQRTHPVYRWLWVASCQPKHKVFFLLLLKNRLNTRGMLRRKNMQLDSYNCELCLLQKEEKLIHLCFKCPFAKICCNLIRVTVPTWLKSEKAIGHIKRALRLPFTMDIIIVMCWCIWTERNVWLFNNKEPQDWKCKDSFKKEFDMVIHRANSR
jgi:hypothetical protein